jgi:hypothetical protein
MPRHRRPRHHPLAPGHPEAHASMPCQPRPEAEEEPPRRDTTQRVRMIERWLHHAEEELLYAPDAAEEAAAPQTASKSSLHQCGNKLTVFPHLIPPDSNRMGIEK